MVTRRRISGLGRDLDAPRSRCALYNSSKCWWTTGDNRTRRRAFEQNQQIISKSPGFALQCLAAVQHLISAVDVICLRRFRAQINGSLFVFSVQDSKSTRSKDVICAIYWHACPLRSPTGRRDTTKAHFSAQTSMTVGPKRRKLLVINNTMSWKSHRLQSRLTCDRCRQLGERTRKRNRCANDLPMTLPLRPDACALPRGPQIREPSRKKLQEEEKPRSARALGCNRSVLQRHYVSEACKHGGRLISSKKLDLDAGF